MASMLGRRALPCSHTSRSTCTVRPIAVPAPVRLQSRPCMQRVRAIELDFSDPDTQLSVAGLVLGLVLGLGAPAWYINRTERDEERLEELRALNRATYEQTGEYMTDVSGPCPAALGSSNPRSCNCHTPQMDVVAASAAAVPWATHAGSGCQTATDRAGTTYNCPSAPPTPSSTSRKAHMPTRVMLPCTPQLICHHCCCACCAMSHPSAERDT